MNQVQDLTDAIMRNMSVLQIVFMEKDLYELNLMNNNLVLPKCAYRFSSKILVKKHDL